MSSPARSSVSATSAGHGGGSSGTAGFVDDASLFHFPTDLASVHDRKEEALSALKSELMAALNKEVKSLDEDAWMFARPRSQIHLISRPGSYLRNQERRHGEVNHANKQTVLQSRNAERAEGATGINTIQAAKRLKTEL